MLTKRLRYRALALALLSAVLTLSACQRRLPVPSAAGDNSFSGKVVGVSDGDTIKVLRDGREEKIRLGGIDCPEKAQPFGTRAKQKTAGLVFGKEVAVHVAERDRYGRAVAEVLLPEGGSLNAELVRSGLCWWYKRYAPNNLELKNLEIKARVAKIGLWSQASPVPPWNFRKLKTSAAPTVNTVAHSGAVKMSKSKICHAPGTRHYQETTNFKSYPSLEECRRAGGRLPRG